jgi:hypothetical protein
MTRITVRPPDDAAAAEAPPPALVANGGGTPAADAAAAAAGPLLAGDLDRHITRLQTCHRLSRSIQRHKVNDKIPDWAALRPLRIDQRGTRNDEKRREKQHGSSTFLKDGHAAKHRSKWRPAAPAGSRWGLRYPPTNWQG